LSFTIASVHPLSASSCVGQLSKPESQEGEPTPDRDAPQECGAHSSSAGHGESCVCDPGYSADGGSCVEMDVKETGTRDAGTNPLPGTSPLIDLQPRTWKGLPLTVLGQSK